MLAKFQQKVAALCLTAIFLIAVLDRLLKSLAIHQAFDGPRQIIFGWLSLNFVPNYYLAFSLPLKGGWLSAVIMAIILVLFCQGLYLFKRADYKKTIWLLVIIIGAASNLYDRLTYGLVIDYLDLRYITVLNLADLMIVAGVAGLIWQVLFQPRQRAGTDGPGAVSR